MTEEMQVLPDMQKSWVSFSASTETAVTTPAPHRVQGHARLTFSRRDGARA